MRALWALLLILLSLNVPLYAKGTYMSVSAFVDSSFSGTVSPAPEKLWLKGDQRRRLEVILGHPVGLRIGFWREGERSAWVLDEIGKELPITIGLVIDAGRLSDIQILAFRESRGGEVRYPFFTRQFVGMTLGNDFRLSDSIDGISGATMSVDAVTRAAVAALYLDSLLPHLPS